MTSSVLTVRTSLYNTGMIQFLLSITQRSTLAQMLKRRYGEWRGRNRKTGDRGRSVELCETHPQKWLFGGFYVLIDNNIAIALFSYLCPKVQRAYR